MPPFYKETDYSIHSCTVILKGMLVDLHVVLLTAQVIYLDSEIGEAQGREMNKLLQTCSPMYRWPRYISCQFTHLTTNSQVADEV